MRRVNFVAGICCALLTMAAFGQSAAPPHPAEWVPADALGFLGVTDIEQTWQQYRQTTEYRFISDPASTRMLSGGSRFGSVVELFRERVAGALGVQPKELENPLSGPLAIFVAVPPGGDGDDLQPGLIATVGRPELMRKYFDTAVERFKETSAYSTDTAGAQTIHVFVRNEDQTAAREPGEDGFRGFEEPAAEGLEAQLDELFSPDAMPSRLAVCLTEQKLYVGSTAEQIKQLLRGPQRSLAATSEYRALGNELGSVGPIRLLVNVPELMRVLRGAAESTTEREQLATWLRSLGLDGVGSLMGTWQFGAQDVDARMEMLLHLTGEPRGLMKLLALPNAAVTPPARATSGTLGCFTLNLDIAQWLTDLQRVMQQSDPQAANELGAALEKFPTVSGEVINLRDAFLQYLRGPLTGFYAAPVPLQADHVPLLLSLRHDNREAVNRFLATALPGLLQPTPFQNHPAYMIAPIPGVVPPQTLVVVTPEHLLIGNRAGLDVALATGLSKPLADDPRWQRVARLAGNEAWFTFYLDNRALLAALIALGENQAELAASGAGYDAGTMLLLMIYEGVRTEMKRGDITRARDLLPYATQSVVTVSTTPAGIRIVQVQAKP